jgi:NAD(P)-dependent dehydrogenase (short-subunit alcohol dehydrogenase family)
MEMTDKPRSGSDDKPVMGRLNGVVTLITGGGSGLGRAIVDRFVSEGAAVGVIDYDQEKLAALSSAYGDAVLTIHGDVRRLDDHHRAVSSIVAKFGRLNALVGVAAITEYARNLGEIPLDRLESTLDEVMAVNFKGYLFAAVAAAPELAKTNGSITLTLSTSGFYPGVSGPIYTFSKHAGVGLVRQLAFEYSPGVRVNGVIPGGVKGSDMRGPTALGQQDTSLRILARDQQVIDMTPLRRMPEDDEYPPIYVLLASKEATLATGSFFFWDGGLGLVGHGMGKALGT